MSSPRPVAVALAELRAQLGERDVVTDADVLDAHRHDRAEWAVAGKPAALVRTRRTADVAATLRVAHRHGIPVVPRGAGSGLSGGRTPSTGGSCSRSRRWIGSSTSTRPTASRWYSRA